MAPQLHIAPSGCQTTTDSVFNSNDRYLAGSSNPRPRHHTRSTMSKQETGGLKEAIGVHGATGMSDELVAQAQTAAEIEKSMPFRQAIRTFWRGGLWSMGLSVALMYVFRLDCKRRESMLIYSMEGYDVGLVSALEYIVP